MQPLRATATTWRWRAALAAVAVLLYLPTVRFGFTFDDQTVILDNPTIQHPAFYAHVWTTSYMNEPRGHTSGAYRPVAMTTLAATWWLGGASAWTFHLGNMLLHALVTLAVFALARRWLASERPAGIVALLFAVHPLHVEPVASIVGRTELLAALFALLAWFAHDSTTLRVRWCAPALYLLAMLSKESAITLLGVLVFSDWLQQAGTGWWRPRLALWGAELAMAAVVLVLRWAVLGRALTAGLNWMPFNGLAVESSLTRILTGLMLLGYHWRLFAWPAPLVADYCHAAIAPVRSLADPRLAAALMLLAVLAAVAFAMRRRVPAVTMGIALWLLGVSIASNIPFLINPLFADRLLYVPSIGMCLAAGAFADWALARAPSLRWTLILIAVALCARTLQSARRWRDNPALISDTVCHQPNSTMAWAHQAMMMADAAEHAAAGSPECTAFLASAEAAANRSLAIYPSCARALYQLARVRGLREDVPGLAAALDQVLEVEPGNEAALLWRMILAQELGEPGRIEPMLMRALEANPENRAALVPLARLRMQQGRLDEARQLAEHAVAGQPLVPANWAALGEICARQHDGARRRRAQAQIEWLASVLQ